MEHEQPLVSIDVVPVRFSRGVGSLLFGTAIRVFEPALGLQALPGVLLKSGESITDAAKRALHVKAGLPAGILRQGGAFDGTNRDPRGATISIALLSVQEEAVDAPGVTWAASPGELPFDHAAIATSLLERLSSILWTDAEVTRALLGESFTTGDALALGSPLLPQSNSGRWLASYPYIARAESSSRSGGVGRPATTWRWI